MKVFVNGKELEVSERISLLDLLGLLNMEVKAFGFAISVNEEVVPKSRYGEYILKEGDKVEIVNIVGGG